VRPTTATLAAGFGLAVLAACTPGGEAVRGGTGGVASAPRRLEAAAAPAAPVLECTNGMCRVPAGPFQMGCDPAAEAACPAKEMPPHTVNVPEFWIDRDEIRVSDYPAATHCEQGAPDEPVHCVNWNELKAHCESLGKRLCTEAEWEKAARGPDGRRYPWGNEIDGCTQAVFSGCFCEGWCPVGSKSPAGDSPYGVRDLAGNVWEWVADTYHPSYDGAPADGSAWEGGASRVVRGGCFVSSAEVLRVSYRHDVYPSHDHWDMGGRCCRSP
jgi:formylglycine-generating enzyme required for sulfatase activity